MGNIKITSKYFYKPNKFTSKTNRYIRDYTTLVLHRKVYGRPMKDISNEDLDLLLAEYERRFKS